MRASAAVIALSRSTSLARLARTSSVISSQIAMRRARRASAAVTKPSPSTSPGMNDISPFPLVPVPPEPEVSPAVEAEDTDDSENSEDDGSCEEDDGDETDEEEDDEDGRDEVPETVTDLVVPALPAAVVSGGVV